MLENNYRYSVRLLEYCLATRVPLIYASSAAVYGASTEFEENDASAERPLNVYGYSKLLFDHYVRRRLRHARTPRSSACATSTSTAPARHTRADGERRISPQRQVADARRSAALRRAATATRAGEQRRDFVYVGDVADVNLWLLEHARVSGIFNVGTGASATFNEVARAIIAWHGKGTIRYIPFPARAQGRAIRASRKPTSRRCAPPATRRRSRTCARASTRYLDALAPAP